MRSAAYGLMALAVVAFVVIYAAVRGVYQLCIPRLRGYTASSSSRWLPTYGA